MSSPGARPTSARKLALIVPAAGSSTRMGGGVRKPFIELRGLPVICHTLDRFDGIAGLGQIVVVAHPADIAEIEASLWPQLAEHGATHLVPGGARRQDSVVNGLDALEPDTGIVLIHDAVRPFVPRRAIEEAVEAAAEHAAAVVAMPVADTVKRARGETAAETVPRGDLWGAQTPQVFEAGLIRRAFEQAAKDGFECTDDAQLVERLGVGVRLVRGSYENFKITTPAHLRMAEALLDRPDAQ